MLFKRKQKNKPKLIWHVPEGTGSFLVPKKSTSGAMAYDLISPTDLELHGMDEYGVGVISVNTLVAVTIPKGHAILLGSRSGLAANSKITVEAGWIDEDYRGVIKVILYNHGLGTYNIKAGDRVAQAKLVKIIDVDEEVSFIYPQPNETKRGDGGLGSTGR